MGLTPNGSRSVAAEINVTPLIDVLLVLLIIFMAIPPASVRGLEALVPQPPRTDRALPNPETVVVQVLGDSGHGVTYKVNDMLLSKAEVEPKLAGIFALRADKAMFVKGDADLDFSLVAEVIDDAHRAGVERVGILTPGVSGGSEAKRGN
jgi:biopolymer transport protein ExbD/biopolymer transport protein TolR